MSFNCLVMVNSFTYLWVSVPKDVLLHAQHGFLWLILAVPHGAKFGQRLFNWSVAMFAFIALTAIILASALVVHFFSCAMTNITLVPLDQVLGKLVQTVKVVACVCDLVRLEPEPLNNFPNGNLTPGQ